MPPPPPMASTAAWRGRCFRHDAAPPHYALDTPSPMFRDRWRPALLRYTPLSGAQIISFAASISPPSACILQGERSYQPPARAGWPKCRTTYVALISFSTSRHRPASPPDCMYYRKFVLRRLPPSIIETLCALILTYRATLH